MDNEGYKYSENHLYTLASQLSRVVEYDTPRDSITTGISKGLRQLYDNGLCCTNITENLMIKAWRLVLLTEIVNDMGNKDLQKYVSGIAKEFVDSLEKLEILEVIKKKLDLE